MSDRSALISKLLGSRKSRESYIRSKLNVLIPAQLRGIRLKIPMTQTELGHGAEMKQSRISAMERPGETQFNVETLIRLASALKVGLKVEFVPFSEMLRWENSFSQDRFNPARIDEDREFIDSSAPSTVDISALRSAAGTNSITQDASINADVSAPTGSTVRVIKAPEPLANPRLSVVPKQLPLLDFEPAREFAQSPKLKIVNRAIRPRKLNLRSQRARKMMAR